MSKKFNGVCLCSAVGVSLFSSFSVNAFEPSVHEDEQFSKDGLISNDTMQESSQEDEKEPSYHGNSQLKNLVTIAGGSALTSAMLNIVQNGKKVSANDLKQLKKFYSRKLIRI